MANLLMQEQSFDIDKLSYEIFSILESKFLFSTSPSPSPPPPQTHGKIRILSIDAAADSAILAALSLSRLETLLKKHSSNPSASVSDFFDAAAGSGHGALLISLLFTRRPDGRPLFTAQESLQFLKNIKSKSKRSKNGGIFSKLIRKGGAGAGAGGYRRTFSDVTLRDTIKPVLIPCYDMSTGSAFTFSRSDAVESDEYDFSIADVCAASCAEESRKAVEVGSVDGKTRLRAMGMGNPTAAAITHVLNNKREFPFAEGVDDLLVVSLGSSETATAAAAAAAASNRLKFKPTKIAGEAVIDTVDQSVAMAFEEKRCLSNYVRIQANSSAGAGAGAGAGTGTAGRKVQCVISAAAEAALSQRYIESVMFRGKKICEETNNERLEWVSIQLINEHDERRKWSSVPTTVLIKPSVSSSRTSSATTATTATVTSTVTSTSTTSL